jgi:geranylgeranyl reductase family protein
MDSCDVLIVGGGPAGSSCAWALRSSGLDVLILDKSRSPRNKICGGWITLPVLEELDIDAAEYARRLLLQPITGFRISCIGGREVEIPYQETVSYGIRRCEFDEFLLRRSGARVREGVTIREMRRNRGGWTVSTDQGEFKTPLLAGAGGHFCPVAKLLGNTSSNSPVVAQEAEFQMTAEQAARCAIRGEVPELYFCRDLRGYGWCFRKGDFLNIGLGRLDQHKLGEHVSRFVDFLRASGKIGFELPSKTLGHAYLLYGYSQRKIVDDGVLLIGDAAGLAYAQSGEGIRPAVESGLMAGDVAGAARGDYSHSTLARYEDALAARFGHAEKSQRLAKNIPAGLRSTIGRLLLRTPRFCRRTVIEDWFLHRGEPPLRRAASIKAEHAPVLPGV